MSLSSAVEYRKHKKELGQCYHCSSPSLPSSVGCHDCLKKQADRVKAIRAKLQARGLCTYGAHCKNPLAPKSKSMCTKHLTQLRRNLQKWKVRQK